MRLTLLSRDAPPMAGGIADHTAILATNLARRGHAVTLVTREGAGTIEGVDVWTHPRFDAAPPRAIGEVIAATQPDSVLWAYNPFSFGARGLARRAPRIAASLKRQLPGTKMIVFAHELMYPKGVGGLKGWLWWHSQSKAFEAVLKASDAMIVTTPDRLPLAKDKGICIPVGSNLPDLDVPIDRIEIRASLGIQPDRYLVAHLGGVGPGRDLGTALDALHDLPHVDLLLAGETGEMHIPVSLQDRIHIPGPQPPEDLARELRAADLYVHLDPVGPTPGRRTTLVAALQAGLPIVAFAGEQTDPRLGETGCVRLVPPRDAPALAAQIRELHQNPEEASLMGRNARALHDSEFDWGRITERVESVLSNE